MGSLDTHLDAKPALFGRRPFANKAGREILNDVSRSILRDQPDYVDDPSDPDMDELLRHHYDLGEKAVLLTDLLSAGLTYQEAVVWYLWRYARLTPFNIYYAQADIDTGGDPEARRNASRNIARVIRSAAEKLDVDVDDDLALDSDANSDAPV